MIKGDCELCDENGILKGHHTSYYPEAKLFVCDSCHIKIHRTDGFYDVLDPDIARPDGYKRASPTGYCSDCAFPIVMGLEEDENSPAGFRPAENCRICGDSISSVNNIDDELLNWYLENFPNNQIRTPEQ